MTKEEYRKHCEEQIERCIKLNDSKHLKEHELSLGLLNENECLIENKYNLIKYLEDKINKIKEQIKNFDIWHETGIDLNFLILQRQWYEEILERMKNNNYENSKN